MSTSIDPVLFERCEQIETRAEFEARLSGPPLAVKLGIDPTGSELHLGHAVVLRKLQEFLDAGHRVHLIIGDFTARIGDPSGRNDQRPALDDAAIAENMRSYREQAAKVLDVERAIVHYNSKWLGRLKLTDLIALLAQTTVAKILDRNDFSVRFREHAPIALHEFLYPIAQAYDSIAVEADVELGGSEQLFNLLLAREYQQHAGQRPQVCITMPLLLGTDGKKKMSKSLGNYIALCEPAREQFGKLMSIPDGVIADYARLAAFRPAPAVERLTAELQSGRTHPMEAKKEIAREIVARYHGAAAAKEAEEHFARTVQRRELPAEDIADLDAVEGQRIAELVVKAGFAESKRAAERLIAGGAVKIDGLAVADPRAVWPAGRPSVLSVGSRKFIRLRAMKGR